MTPVRLLARPLLASVFVSGGIEAFRQLEPHVEQAEPVIDAVAEPLGLPDDPELLTKVNGGVMIGAGLLLALGKAPRLASAALAGTLIPTTFAGHRFWEIDDPEERSAQQIHFMKNMGLLGGLALAAVDTAGKPGVAWRARYATRAGRREAKAARRVAQAEARRAASKISATVSSALPGG